MNFHWKWSFVMSMWMNIAASTMITTAPTQRHGCRTGTALIGSDRARSGVESVMCDSLGHSCESDRPDQGVGFTVGLVMAPTCTPHLVRIWLYVPSAINSLTALATAPAKSVWSFGRTKPYSAAS